MTKLSLLCERNLAVWAGAGKTLLARTIAKILGSKQVGSCNAHIPECTLPP